MASQSRAHPLRRSTAWRSQTLAEAPGAERRPGRARSEGPARELKEGVAGVRLAAASPRAAASAAAPTSGPGARGARPAPERSEGASQLLQDASAACEGAFEAEDPSRCSEAIGQLGAALARAGPKVGMSSEAARFCAMLSAVLQHPSGACREAAVCAAAREVDVALLLRSAPRALSCPNGLDTARRLQVVENILRAARIIASAEAGALDRCRQSGGLVTAMEVWRQAGHAPGPLREAVQLARLFVPSQARAVVASGGVDMALAAWQRFSQQPQPVSPASSGQAAAFDIERHNLALQATAELLLSMLPFVEARRLLPATGPTVQALQHASSAQGSQRVLLLLLQLASKMSQDAALAQSLAQLGTHRLALDLLGRGDLTGSVAMRRAMANACVHVRFGASSEPRRSLSVLPRQVGSEDACSDRRPGAAGTFGWLSRLPDVCPELAGLAVRGLSVPPASLPQPAACAAALHKHLQALCEQRTPRARTAVFPPPASGGAAEVAAAPEGHSEAPLVFDASFEGANLRCATLLGPFEYELQLSVDLCNPAHCQWFFWRASGMSPGQRYTFHIVNLCKPASLFEEGSQPVMLSRRRYAETGVGWTREGEDVAYYANGAVLGSGKEDGRSKPAHTLSFSVVFPHREDDVFFAHFFPYTHRDQRLDLERWCGGRPPAEIERRELLRTPGGLPVDLLRVGAPLGSKPLVVLLGRAHPGESPGSWLMRGACDFLLADGGEGATACRSALSWLIVPMLNPDGVMLGNTRTNAGGVDLNRRHHDDSAPETSVLRTALNALSSLGSWPPLAFVDMHGHSRRRGVFFMGNAGSSARLPCLLAQRSPLFDLSGTVFYGTKGGKDAGVGRVAMAARGCPHSFTMEASFGALGGSDRLLAPGDLEAVGRDLCLAVRELTEPELEPTVFAPATSDAPDDD